MYWYWTKYYVQMQLAVLSGIKLVEFLEHKPRGLEIVLTGHAVSDKVLELADYVTLRSEKSNIHMIRELQQEKELNI